MRCPTITNSFLQQEYPTYTILGQSQYQTCYPSSGFGVVPPADSNTESMALATTTYPAEKPNALVPARVVQRPSSGEAGSVKDDCKIPLLNSAGGRCGETSPKGTYRHLFMLGQMGHLPSLSNWSHWCAEYYGGPAILMYQKPSTAAIPGHLPCTLCAPGKGNARGHWKSCQQQLPGVFTWAYKAVAYIQCQ